VHHVVILGKWPMWCTIIFYIFIFIFNSLHVLSTSCSSSEETNCVNATSGSCHSVSVTGSCASQKWTEFISDLHTTRPEVVLTQFVSPDDEHDVLKTCRELKIKINTKKRTVPYVRYLPRIFSIKCTHSFTLWTWVLIPCRIANDHQHLGEHVCIFNIQSVLLDIQPAHRVCINYLHYAVLFYNGTAFHTAYDIDAAWWPVMPPVLQSSILLWLRLKQFVEASLRLHRL